VTARPPAPLPPKSAATPLRNAFLNRLVKDAALKPPPLELLALIDLLDAQMAVLSSRLARLEDEE